MKILIVEDDKRIALPLREELEHQNYDVELAFDGESGQRLAETGKPDVIILDLMLPKLNGLQLCHELRKSGYPGGILILTARSARRDKVAGLDTGADDYLTKPFDMEELLARIRALGRRTPKGKGSLIAHGDIRLDPQKCSASYRETPIALTPTEFRLLAHLMRNPNTTFSKQALVDRLWLDDTPTEQAIKTYIKSLRNKLGNAGAPRDVIETVYGFGYRLK